MISCNDYTISPSLTGTTNINTGNQVDFTINASNTLNENTMTLYYDVNKTYGILTINNQQVPQNGSVTIPVGTTNVSYTPFGLGQHQFTLYSERGVSDTACRTSFIIVGNKEGYDVNVTDNSRTEEVYCPNGITVQSRIRQPYFTVVNSSFDPQFPTRRLTRYRNWGGSSWTNLNLALSLLPQNIDIDRSSFETAAYVLEFEVNGITWTEIHNLNTTWRLTPVNSCN